MQGIIYSQLEENYYSYLYNSFKSNHDYITPQEVFNLFMKSGLDKAKLKEIWDLSNVRKAPNLNKLEFFSACRYLALFQNNQTRNLILYNDNHKFMPRFEGISYNFPVHPEEKKKIEFDDDFEEFTDYSKVTSHSNLNANTNYNENLNFNSNFKDSNKGFIDPSHVINADKSSKMKENNDINNNTLDKKNQIKVEEIKMLDSMIKELKTRNLTLNELDSINNKNDVQPDNNFSINTNTNQQVNLHDTQNNKPSQPPKDLDSLLKMLDTFNNEEPTRNSSEITNANINIDKLNNNNLNNGIILNTINTNLPIHNLNTKNDDDEFEEFEEHNTENNRVSTINNDLSTYNNSLFNPNSTIITNENTKPTPQEYIPPSKEEKKPRLENFNMDSLLNDFSSIRINQQEKISEKRADAVSEVTKEPAVIVPNSNVETFPKKDLMDLLDNMNFLDENDDKGEKEANIQQNIIHNQITNTPIENTIKIDPSTNENKISVKENLVDDLEFFEFEDANEQKETTNANDVNNNINIPIYEEGTFSKELELHKKEEIVNKIKEEKPNILSYTPNDFLREFMNESKKKESNEFEFVEDTVKVEKTEEVKQEMNNENQNNTFESLINRLLKEKSYRILFYKNTIKLKEIITKELINVHKNVEDLLGMNITKEEEESLKHNKKFSNFIEGSIVLLSLYHTIENTYKNILELEEFRNEGIDNNNIDKNEKAKKIISDLKKNSKRFIYEERMKELLNFSSNLNNNFNLSNQYCNLCITELKDFPSTNIFLHDFHIHCINFWINTVDQRSPYQL